MRISHNHQFVFLATPRTGSTTIRSLLDEHSELKSVHRSEITADFPFYHHIAAAELKSIFDSRGWDWARYKAFCVVRNPYDRVVSLYHHHQKITQRRLERAGVAERFLRHTRELVRPTKTFRDYVMSINVHRRLTTSLPAFLCDRGGQFLVKDVLRFEYLDDELPRFLQSLGIDFSTDIPRLNASNDRKDYRDYYDDRTRERVRELYKYEIDRFEYEY